MSIIAYTHCAIFTAAARPFLDQLSRHGFPIPEDAGKGAVCLGDTVDHRLNLGSAVRHYEDCCEEVMGEATSIRIGALHAARSVAISRLGFPGWLSGFWYVYVLRLCRVLARLEAAMLTLLSRLFT